MKVVALVSGGKDSCYNMMLCEQYGHQVVALANLLPRDEGVDDLDSHMFQTVGHQLVGMYAECMGLPLFRRKIQGSSVKKDLVYDVMEEDEVEDMMLLLHEVKTHFPDVGAVSSGAIASDYQRLRVEHVCSRLGLVSLSYMWLVPQVELFDSMVKGNVHALLIKVASLGLTPQEHLGKPLNELRETLYTLREKYESNMCGEGGEYETLVLDCPLFKFGKIVLDEANIVVTSQDPFSPSGVLHPKAFHVEAKSGSTSDTTPVIVEVTGNGLPSDRSESHIRSEQDEVAAACKASARTKLKKSDCYMHIVSEGFIDGSSASADARTPSNQEISACMESMLDGIKSELEGNRLSWSNCIYVHLYLSDMTTYSVANSEYCKVFPLVSPPARACVGLPLSPGVLCQLDLLAYSHPKVVDGRPREVLHVQSISQWAPCCIGPYSQANSCGGVIHMAGQLGFHSPTMKLVSGGLSAQFSQALHHCQSVAVAMGSDVRKVSMGFVNYVSMKACEGPGYVKDLTECLYRFNPHVFWWDGKDDCSSPVEETSDTDLDHYLIPPVISGGIPPLVMYLGVPSLPRDALIEVQPMAFDARKVHIWDESDDTPDSDAPPVIQDPIHDINVVLSENLGLSFWEQFTVNTGCSVDVCGRFVSVTSMASRLNLWISQEKTSMEMNLLGHGVFKGLCYFLHQCQLSWADVSMCRLVCLSSRMDFMHELLKAVNRSAQEADLVELDGVFVPVLAIGPTPAMDNIALVDVLTGGGWGKPSGGSQVF